MRIAKWLSLQGQCSRREAERLIEQGCVKVNDTLISHPATFITDTDQVKINDTLVGRKEKVRLWVFHKPKGLITTHKDPQKRPTVFDKLPDCVEGRVVSVGRLDLNSEGLLLLTNHAPLAHYFEQPKNQVERVYRVRIHGHGWGPDYIKQLAAGIKVDGVHYAPITVVTEKTNRHNHWIKMTLHEGKNREIRRIFEHFGFKVDRLIRVSYGPFALDELKTGEAKEAPYKLFKPFVAEKS